MKSCVRYTIAVYFGLALAGVLGGPTATGEGRSHRRLLGNQAPQWPIQQRGDLPGADASLASDESLPAGPGPLSEPFHACDSEQGDRASQDR